MIKNYGLFCKYQLIKYKPWHLCPLNAWENEEESDTTFVLHWKRFLDSETGKSLVPNWYREIQYSALHSVNTNSQIEDDDSQLSKENDCEKDEWMYIAEMAKCDDTELNINVNLINFDLKENFDDSSHITLKNK